MAEKTAHQKVHDQIIQDEKDAEKVFQDDLAAARAKDTSGPSGGQTFIMPQIAQVLKDSGADTKQQEDALEKIRKILGFE